LRFCSLFLELRALETPEMRIVLIACVMAFYATGTHGTDKGKYRPATEAQIRTNLPGAQELAVKRNDFEYKAGGNVGYKINNGQICVKNSKSKVECVRMNYDGKNLQMIDKLGNREVVN
jgi:hypothetical protein